MHFGKDHAEFMLSMYRREWEDPDKIVKQLPIGPGSDIVDLGCGPGFFTIPLAKETDGKVYAIDASDEMIDGYLVDIDWKKEPSTHGPPMDIRIDRKEALLLISSHNFEIIKEIETGNNHYGLLFQKR